MVKIRDLSLWILIALAFTFNTYSEQAQLIYLPNTPVLLHSIFSAELEQSPPNLSFKSTLHQELEASILLNNPANLPIAEGPLDMTFKLLDLKVDLQANNISTHFNAKKPETSLFLAEIKDILNRPLRIYFDHSLHMRPETTELQQLAKELPILSNMHPQSLVEELFQHLFSLAGKKLSVGDSFTIVGETPSPDITPQIINYQISDIDNKHIKARLIGSIKLPPTPLKTTIQSADKTKMTAMLNLKGEMEGEIIWQRNNALIHELQIKAVYQGSINGEQSKWPIRLELKHSLNSKKIDAQ